MLTARNTASIILLAAAAAGSWYVATSLSHEPAPEQPDSALQTGYYLRSARILGTGEQGELLYEIEAEYAEQQPDNSIEFDNVRIRYSPAAAVPWTVTADNARIGDNQRHLVLEGHVLAVSTDGFSGQATEIRTEWLALEPEDYRAATDSRVQIRIGSKSLTATGMVALLQDDRLELKSNVSGKFVP